LATVAMSSAGSTGFETWTRKPARSARVRSSERAKAVRAIAGTRPPLACPSARTLLRSSYTSTPGMPMSLTRTSGRSGRDDLRVAFRQDPLNQIARIRLIVDHQHGHTRKVRPLEIGGDAAAAL